MLIKGQEKFRAWEPHNSQSSIYQEPFEHKSHTKHVTAAVRLGQSVVVCYDVFQAECCGWDRRLTTVLPPLSQEVRHQSRDHKSARIQDISTIWNYEQDSGNFISSIMTMLVGVKKVKAMSVFGQQFDIRRESEMYI